jgi:hypothetical protein
VFIGEPFQSGFERGKVSEILSNSLAYWLYHIGVIMVATVDVFKVSLGVGRSEGRLRRSLVIIFCTLWRLEYVWL